MRALVTGGAGFIGSAVVRALIARGDEALVYDKLTYAGRLSSLAPVADSPRFRFVHACVTDASALRAAIDSFSPDAILHLAAESHVDRSIDGARAFVETNVVGTFTVLEEARRYWAALPAARRDAFRVLHVSTDEVFGSLGPDGAFSETTAYDPRSPYAATKAGADHLARAWAHTHGLPVVISNCSNNYGAYHLPEKLIPLMILNGLEGLPLPVYGDGLQVRDWLYVDDHAEALLTIVEKGAPGRSYNVGGASERTNLAVVEQICDLLDRLAPARAPRRSLMERVPDRPGHDRRYAIDATRIASELGWRARTDFETGLERTVAWYLANEAWWRPIREEGVGRARLGLGG
jgi:dTDP-glucose 4,6-dehydratase